MSDERDTDHHTGPSSAAGRPTIEELRRRTQPPDVRGRRNSEHWTADLYQRRISPYLTRVLIAASVSANAVTGLMIVTGAAAGAALLIPGLVGAVLAALLGQLQMLWDCCDGEVARWRETFSPVGVFLDKVGHYTAEGLIPICLGVRADGGVREIGGWTTLGAVLAVLVLYNKALNDAVHVARAASGLPRLQDRAEHAVPRAPGLRRARSLARFVPFHRAFHSIELTLLALIAATADVVVGNMGATRVLLAVLVPAAVLTVIGHLLAILSSSRLR